MFRFTRTLAALVLAVAATAAAQARPSHPLTLPGTITLSDGVVVPPGSTLRVKLHDLSPGIAKDATVANEAFEVSGKRPIQFELVYNPSLIEPSRLYGIAAVITDSRGQAVCQTRVPIRVLTMGNQKKVELLLRPVEQPKAAPEPTSVTLECEGHRFHVDLSPISATVLLEDSKLVLPITDAVSGKRYSDGASTLALSGSAAYFQRPGKAYRDCKVRVEPEAAPHP